MAYTIASGACSSVNSWVTSPAAASRRLPDELDRLGELVRPAAADAEHVDLLEREVADPDRRALAREADDDHAAGLGHELDRGLYERRARPSPRSRPRARPRPAHSRVAAARSSSGATWSTSAPIAAPRSRRLAERVDEQHRGAAVGRRQRERLADRAGAEDDDPLAVGDAPAHHRAHGDRDGLDQGGEGRILVSYREDLGGGHEELLLERAVGVHADQADVRAGVAAPDAARVAASAGRDRPERHAHPRRELGRAVGAHLEDRGGHLVPLDPRVQRGRIVDRPDVPQ